MLEEGTYTVSLGVLVFLVMSHHVQDLRIHRRHWRRCHRCRCRGDVGGVVVVGGRGRQAAQEFGQTAHCEFGSRASDGESGKTTMTWMQIVTEKKVSDRRPQEEEQKVEKDVRHL